MPAFAQTHETTIAAPPERVHALIADFREWQKWSPWEGLDPDLEREYDGHGVGQRYHWSGNKKAGEGEMRMTGLAPERIDIDLEFVKPFKAQNKIDFVITPEGEGTRVAWSMSGRRNVVLAAAGKLFFDKAIGEDFERGLASLKAEAERG
jgi:uncharacterized protein YndB with AHSA1/START domain